MEIHENAVLELPISRVWAAVNDPGILKLAVPGIQELNAVDPNSYTAKAVIKVGFISARFNDVKVKRVQAIENQQLNFEISGEDANRLGGFKLNMEVKLGDIPGNPPKTSLEVRMTVDMRGKFASLGRKLVEWKSKSMMDEFVKNLRGLPS